MKTRSYGFILVLLICAVLLVSFPSLVKADFNFTLKNTDSQLRVVTLLWMDHPFDYDYPFAIAGAELKPGAEFSPKYKYKPGVYLAEWAYLGAADPDKVYIFEVGDGVNLVEITPDRAAKVR
jgi:hypothetical protein